MDAIDQQVITNNKDIYAKIQSELQKARSEIVIATAWFTDEDLFNILLDKLDESVQIEIIIADNQENEKLNFNRLIFKGASVYKIKNSGYGIMNQKFCVIDKRIALHGSYNWTINAKKNNHESIISTNHQETIDSLLENFNTIKNNIQEQKDELIQKNGALTQLVEKYQGTQIQASVKTGVEFEKVLDSMIAAEVGNFDRTKLREHGTERCSANNGDHQVLYKAFDTLYSTFINDIDVVDDKKRRLITKIEEYRIKSQDSLLKECELQVDFLEQENELTQNNLETKRTTIETELAIAIKNIDDIKERKIPSIEKNNTELELQIKVMEREYIKPQFKWFEFIPTLIFNVALLVYLFIFYSSAAYILLFSVEDAKVLELQNIPVAAAQIFNPEAITKAWHKNGTAPWFIFLFVFIPLASAAVDRFVPRKQATLYSILGFVFGIIILDGAIAYKVTQAVHEVNYIRGNVNLSWHPKMAFADMNFYLVFVFGALGLILYKLSFKKLLRIFEDRSPDTLTQQNWLLIKQLREEIKTNTENIMSLQEHVTELEKNTLQLQANIKRIDLELAALPKLLNQNRQKKRAQQLKDAETIDKIAAIYSMHIQSDNLPISIDALKDRINIFLEGWNDFLYKEFANEKAARKTAQAAEVAAQWQSEKLSARKVDKRVKFSQDA